MHRWRWIAVGTAVAIGASTAVPFWHSSQSMPAARHAHALSASASHGRLVALGRIIGRSQQRDGPRAHFALTSAGLQIPWSNWPSSSTVRSARSLGPSDADAGSNLFAFAHSKSYASQGVQGGQAQQALLPIGGNDGAAELWLATYYDTADHANAVVEDAASTLKNSGVPAAPCGSSFPHCYVDAVGVAAQVINYVMFALQNAVGEVATVANEKTDNVNHAAINNAFSTLSQAGVTTVNDDVTGSPLSNPPLAPTVSLDWVEALVQKSGADKLVTKLTAKGSAYFIAAYHTENAGSAVPTATLRIMKSGKLIKKYTMTQQTAPSHFTYFVYTMKKFPQAAIGSVTARFDVNLGSATDSRSLKVSIRASR